MLIRAPATLLALFLFSTGGNAVPWEEQFKEWKLFCLERVGSGPPSCMIGITKSHPEDPRHWARVALYLDRGWKGNPDHSLRASILISPQAAASTKTLVTVEGYPEGQINFLYTLAQRSGCEADQCRVARWYVLPREKHLLHSLDNLIVKYRTEKDRLIRISLPMAGFKEALSGLQEIATNHK